MTPEWLEVRLDTSQAGAEQLEHWLFDAGALSVTLQDSLPDDAIAHAVLEPMPGEVRLWAELTLVGLFELGMNIEELYDRLYLSAARLGLSVPVIRVSRLADRQWERAWMDTFQPMQFGERFWICPREHPPIDESAVNLKLDPGLAFGTGTHATTAQCLSWMGGQTVRSLQPLQGLSVIDYGCGSGVLAIAALLLGAERAWAVDIDPQAITATLDNARHNGVLARLTAGPPSLVDGIAADLLLANILFKPLMDLADRLAMGVVPGGRLVVSGILSEQIQPLRLRYNEHFDFEPGQARDGWAMLTAIRR